MLPCEYGEFLRTLLLQNTSGPQLLHTQTVYKQLALKWQIADQLSGINPLSH